MKKFLAFLLLSVAVQSASAQDPFKKTCFLPYDLSEDEGVKYQNVFEIYPNSKLTPLQKTQVADMAARWGSQSDYDGYKNLQHSIEIMRNDSEGEELNYAHFTYKGVAYVEIIMYPGGNPFAVIYKGSKAIAERHDGDLLCLKTK